MSTEETSRPEQRPRAIFSNADFPMLKTAVAHYARTCEDPAEANRYANLLHRLGRAG
ncbi:hypothetical protein [Croceicoccus pelagius]|uniref:Uncharacterized protein n=1 Tax=Croceicoccus pelagius TaxID=1703341 RepID=A0A916YMX1_9SPHN|nr:hypothetical protein [Croceicoccus pelagius]GGD52290.1 hypothetical protein GCM10010989_27970 [Croceicoccus pelagius]